MPLWLKVALTVVLVVAGTGAVMYLINRMNH